MIISRMSGWLTAKIGEEVVMMNADKALYIGLNPVGARIWELIDSPRELDEVRSVLLEEFEVTAEVCQAELDNFVADLVKHGAATLAP